MSASAWISTSWSILEKGSRTLPVLASAGCPVGRGLASLRCPGPWCLGLRCADRLQPLAQRVDAGEDAVDCGVREVERFDLVFQLVGELLQVAEPHHAGVALQGVQLALGLDHAALPCLGVAGGDGEHQALHLVRALARFEEELFEQLLKTGRIHDFRYIPRLAINPAATSLVGWRADVKRGAGPGSARRRPRGWCGCTTRK